jgi:hypothetical protein
MKLPTPGMTRGFASHESSGRNLARHMCRCLLNLFETAEADVEVETEMPTATGRPHDPDPCVRARLP